ncbi:hypothetical protein P7K49_039566, partial [Saguinus oedipus]
RCGRSVRHYGHNPPLLRYHTLLTHPAVAEATSHIEETPPTVWSAPQRNGAPRQQGGPVLAGWSPSRQKVNRLPSIW